MFCFLFLFSIIFCSTLNCFADHVWKTTPDEVRADLGETPRVLTTFCVNSVSRHGTNFSPGTARRQPPPLDYLSSGRYFSLVPPNTRGLCSSLRSLSNSFPVCPIFACFSCWRPRNIFPHSTGIQLLLCYAAVACTSVPLVLLPRMRGPDPKFFFFFFYVAYLTTGSAFLFFFFSP